MLVTGACGRLGSAVASRLAAAGHKVIATDMQSDSANLSKFHENVQYFTADLRSASDVAKLPWSSIKSVVHLAAFPGPSSYPPPNVSLEAIKRAKIGLEDVDQRELLLGNVSSAWNVLESSARHGVKRVVFSSSAFSYGYSHAETAFIPRYLPIDEDHPQLPHETYGLSKVVGELSASLLSRCGGKSSRTTEFVSLLFTNIVKRELFDTLPWKISGEDEEILPTMLMWAYTHEDDVIDAHIKALSCELPKDTNGHLRLIIAADDTRYDETTQSLLEKHYTSDNSTLDDIELKSILDVNPFASVLSNAQAKKVLDWSPKSWRNLKGGDQKTTPRPGEIYWHADESLGDLYIPRLELESKEILSNAFVSFQTHGQLNAERSNAILLLTSFDATHNDVLYHIGPKKTLDTNKYYVIVVNHLGNGQSFSPIHAPPVGEKRFPSRVGCADQSFIISCVLDALDVQYVQLAYGYSMGAVHALHLAAIYPSRVRRVAAVCGATRARSVNQVFLSSLQHCIYAARGWNDELRWFEGAASDQKAALRAFARIYAGWGVSAEFYEGEEYLGGQDDYIDLEDFSKRSYEKGFENADINNLMAQISTWKGADLSSVDGLGELGNMESSLDQIEATVLWMPCTTDKYFRSYEIEQDHNCMKRAGKTSIFAPIESSWGHRAGDPSRPGQEKELQYIKESINSLLELPV
mmetsp:Transcript_8908/g.13303  ORF Transcript_8908/g.13303 Transcript_8908/m.13303 type:complete len:694 (-) Transcript_8908:61-2142(-)